MKDSNITNILSRILSEKENIPDYYFQDLYPFMSNLKHVSGVVTPFYSLLLQLGFPDDCSFFIQVDEAFDFERLEKKEKYYEGLFVGLLKVPCIDSLLLV